MIRLLVALLVLAGAASAQGTGELDTLDRRGKLLGWEAVGRIETPGRALHRRDGRVRRRADRGALRRRRLAEGRDDTFRAGYANGRSIADREVVRIVIHEGWRGAGGDRLDVTEIPNDLALLELGAPIYSSEADPFRVSPPRPRATG